MYRTYNCIVVFNKAKDAALFCKRQKNPYEGRYNFVGGKVEPGDTSEDAAYRELQEETNPLLWLPLSEDFTDRDRFAGEQNIAHIMNIALMYPIPAVEDFD